MGQSIFQVNAFTDRPYRGNPASVCFLQTSADETWMRSVAGEMGVTAFLLAESGAPNAFHLRWFTPIAELDFCGHGTLAAAHILYECGFVSLDVAVRFHTRNGWLTAQRRADLIEMDFPNEAPYSETFSPLLLNTLGLHAQSVRFTGRNQFDCVIEVDSEADVRAVAPNFASLATHTKELGVRGVIVTSRATSMSYDFISRFFAPALGINEDQVTGSAHCCLAPYWKNKLEKNDLTAFQASPRGGELHARVRDNRVLLSGKAVTVLRGEFLFE